MKKELALTILLVVLTSIGWLLNHRLLSAYNVGNNLNYIGIWGIMSIGLGIVIITGGIDLSLGSVFALQGVILAMGVGDWHLPGFVALVLSLLVVLLIGLFHGFCVTVLKLQPFIVTLCGLLFYRGMARFLAHDQAMGFDSPKLAWFRGPLTHHYVVGGLSISTPFVVLVVVSAVMWVVLHRSVYGRYLFAVGRNEEAARFSGINTRMVIGSAYVLGMALTAISGLLWLLDTGSAAPGGAAEGYELYGIAAAVLGGCSLRGGEGSIIGIVLGAALIQLLRNLVPLVGIDSSLERAVMGAVIFIGVTVDQVLGNRKRGGKSLGAAPATAATATGIPAPTTDGPGDRAPSA